MLALMTVTLSHHSDAKSVPRAKGAIARKAAGAKQATFMDIFACRRCKKNRGKAANCAENEGYSSADEDYRSPSADRASEPLGGVSEEDSLRRPLRCRRAIGDRQAAAGARGEGRRRPPAAGPLDSWRSLPNLRSPSLAVRAMTLRPTSVDDDTDRRRRTTAKKKKKKRARFSESVDVIVHGDRGQPLGARIVRIKFDDMDAGRASASASRPPPQQQRRPRPDAIRLDLVDVRRAGDGRRRRLKCVIFIGEEFDRRRISVRTAMGGSRLVLVAYKSEPLGDGTYYWQQYVESFRLPHAIDPNRVDAVMHSAGDLVIEAPLFDFEADTG